MLSTPLFIGKGLSVTTDSLLSDLRRLRADECDILYIHSGLSFGQPAKALSRQNLLEQLMTCILDLGVDNVCFPTYTFSFCNHEPFDPEHTPSRMGALSEFARRLPESWRSVDPLLSTVLLGSELDLVTDLGTHSIGEGSTFWKLSQHRDVKFLFLGVDLGSCFTFMHYLEWLARVPYRYNRSFGGNLILNGDAIWVQYQLFVRYANVLSSRGSYDFQEYLFRLGLLDRITVGNSHASIVNMEAAREIYLNILDSDPNYFIEGVFDPDLADESFEYGPRVAL